VTREALNLFAGISMEKFEDKIIDLVDVISEPDPDRRVESMPAPAEPPLKASPTGIETAELESLVRKEVERLIRSTINENIQKMIREILVQEVEIAVAREIESLKRT
jgi:hypothetical protein